MWCFEPRFASLISSVPGHAKSITPVDDQNLHSWASVDIPCPRNEVQSIRGLVSCKPVSTSEKSAQPEPDGEMEVVCATNAGSTYWWSSSAEAAEPIPCRLL